MSSADLDLVPKETPDAMLGERLSNTLSANHLLFIPSQTISMTVAVEFQSVVTHIYPLAEIVEAFNERDASPADSIHILIDCSK
ncbi:hypothetical protein G0Q06_02155 [Puniceicoccales bacterium CK1056]|uniref:Uncharacterized protein n=1 Tax=Oceanipulchritudo coccoides TaxID=2706888 RepID=A0A6B2LYX8_9BACT|nr:hypothetical protein [Oceanipulchritudo coccoides]NDV61249.1 hypothetical protein [Oceanipulchritudo coccoides]